MSEKTPHIATSDAQYTFEEVQVLKDVDEYKRKVGKNFMTTIELYRLLKDQGRIRETAPAEMPIIRRAKPLRRIDV
jgi:hypothetical protein